MLPLGECLHRIALAAAMVNEFVVIHKNTNKTQLLLSNLRYTQPLVVHENFVPQTRPPNQLIDAKCCIKMWKAMIGAEELADISSYQMFWADNNSKSYEASTKLIK